jgi:glutathione S-transferase
MAPSPIQFGFDFASTYSWRLGQVQVAKNAPDDAALDEYPHLLAWFERVRELPAWRNSFALVNFMRHHSSSGCGTCN